MTYKERHLRVDNALGKSTFDESRSVFVGGMPYGKSADPSACMLPAVGPWRIRVPAPCDGRGTGEQDWIVAFELRPNNGFCLTCILHKGMHARAYIHTQPHMRAHTYAHIHIYIYLHTHAIVNCNMPLFPGRMSA